MKDKQKIIGTRKLNQFAWVWVLFWIDAIERPQFCDLTAIHFTPLHPVGPGYLAAYGTMNRVNAMRQQFSLGISTDSKCLRIRCTSRVKIEIMAQWRKLKIVNENENENLNVIIAYAKLRWRKLFLVLFNDDRPTDLVFWSF